MNDAEKLNLLADWFDVEQNKGRWGSDREVQEDLRDIAKRILAIGGNVPQQADTPDANNLWECKDCKFTNLSRYLICQACGVPRR